jgi:hypothetical protein
MPPVKQLMMPSEFRASDSYKLSNSELKVLDCVLGGGADWILAPG